jgi:nesprin-1
MERGRVLRRPHYLSNCNTALEFLRSKRIKLVNINAADVVDGRPAVVLGLIWTIILYFQVRRQRLVNCTWGFERHGFNSQRSTLERIPTNHTLSYS